MDGYERLQKLYEKDFQNTPVIRIVNYLLKQSDMKEKYENEEKTVKQMFEYITGKAKDFKIGNAAIIEDDIVFSWAMEYFNVSNEELGLNKKPEKIVPKVAKINEDKKEDNPQMQLSLEFG